MLRLLLQCAKCGNRMQYEARDSILSNKIKRCVYCGKHFRVKNAIVRQSP